MAFLTLVGELSILLKLAWVGWAIWGVCQIEWLRRARIPRTDVPENRLLLSINARAPRPAPSAARIGPVSPKFFDVPFEPPVEPEPMTSHEAEVTPPVPAFATSPAGDTPAAAPTRKRRRRARADGAVPLPSLQ